MIMNETSGSWGAMRMDLGPKDAIKQEEHMMTWNELNSINESSRWTKDKWLWMELEQANESCTNERWWTRWN